MSDRRLAICDTDLELLNCSPFSGDQARDSNLGLCIADVEDHFVTTRLRANVEIPNSLAECHQESDRPCCDVFSSTVVFLLSMKPPLERMHLM